MRGAVTPTRAYRVTFEPQQGAPRTPPEVICDLCHGTLTRTRETSGIWALQSQQVSGDAVPAKCDWCHVRLREAADEPDAIDLDQVPY